MVICAIFASAGFGLLKSALGIMRESSGARWNETIDLLEYGK